MKDCKDPSLSSKLGEAWKNAYDEGIFHLLDGILYHRSEHTCVMALKDRTLISTILNEFHDSVASGHLSENRTLERCQKENSTTGKRFGMMIQIKEPKSPVEIVHMSWVTALPPGGDGSYNSCLVLVDRYSKHPIFLPCHKDDTAIGTAIMILNKFISHTGPFQNIISYRDPKFTSAL
ncbi:hypothetical protein O181_073306 [Austropuccinia psidii MF-1]|uniref:Integrase catalytic domain-containing protein n=1 Tax=Austropuccinia psidii MF-1 TaxID=1389203 RepID=A0A9Q3I859_9BASI|nr:hypothetical protein [Austropuccinia psidii MF-1]